MLTLWDYMRTLWRLEEIRAAMSVCSLPPCGGGVGRGVVVITPGVSVNIDANHVSGRRVFGGDTLSQGD